MKKGLLAGEKLHYDLKRMEVAYLEQNKREYEITKHVSLALLDPLALVKLRETGECLVELPEMLFDLDYPGHSMRRTKSVSLTIPCVVGPYTSVNCRLTLLKNSVRKSSAVSGDYNRDLENEDPRFVDNLVAIQSIATSSAQNDSGLFELNFRDERYLPFEGAGAISLWRIELSKDKDLRSFDYETISDVILHLKYTAREGGDALRVAAISSLKDLLFEAEDRKPLMRLFSIRHEFPSEWHQFLHLPKGEDHELKLNLISERFPFLFQGNGKTISIVRLDIFLKLKDDASAGDFPLYIAQAGQEAELAEEGQSLGSLLHRTKELSGEIPSEWLISIKRDEGVNDIEDMFVIWHYIV